ncbi:MAG TPA: flavodoxin family protein [Pseudobacteroides sp.]|uniref:flavodoxin family protein n=1 Tax=Pseudobacteroides sp. TaxID=1968840 RepID=UPI002F92A994
MAKVIGIVGSPRRGGNTSAIVNQVLKGAEASGAEIKIYYLNEFEIKGCQSCMYCRKNDSCSLKDDMQTIFEDMKSADAVILGSPIYIHQVSGQMKIFMDRLYPFTNEKHTPRFGIKKLVMVYTQAAPFELFFRNYIRYLRKAFAAMGLKHFADIRATKCFEPNAAKNNQRLMCKAFAMGKKII